MVQPLFSNEYLLFRYQGGGWPIRQMLHDYWQRLTFLRNLPKEVPLWIEKELFPWVPGEFECRLLRKRRFIIDFDDAVHVWYKPFPVLRQKFSLLVHGAFEVHAGNTFLAEECRVFQKRVKILPTVLDPEEYRTRTGRGDPSKLVVGWIGGPLSRSHLESLIPILESLDGLPIQLQFMGVGNPLCTALPQSLSAWSSQAEKEFCAHLDVGIMPLSDEPFSQGKCGFKLLQYMSAKVATIASRSKANNDILDSGKYGILASSKKEWQDALIAFHETPGLLEKYGELGNKRVREEYSLKKWAPIWVDSIQRLLS